MEYKNELQDKLNEDVEKIKKQENEKLKKLIKKILFIVVIFIILGLLKYFNQYSAPWFTYEKELNDYTSSNTTQTFENIDLSDGNQYMLGLYYNNSQYVRDRKTPFKTDGNYTIEYYNNEKLIRKAIYNKNYYTIGFSSSQSYYHRTPLDKINIPKDVNGKNLTIKLITHTPFSFLKELDKNSEKVDFFIIKRSKAIVNLFDEMNRESKQSSEDRPKNYSKIPFIVNDKNTTHIPLLKALITKDYEKIKQIIEEDNGLDSNTILGHVKADLIFYRVPKFRTPLIYAAYFNDTKTLKFLIEKGSQLNHKDFQKQNALGYAIQNNSLEATKILLDAGAKLDDVDYILIRDTQQATSPLIASVANNSYEMTKLLLEYGAEHKFISHEIQHSKFDVYFYLYRIDDYKRILQLLIYYNISSIGASKPDAERLQDVYKHCEIYKGDIVPRGMDLCIPIVDRNITIDEMDIFIYYEMKYMSRKFEESPEQRKRIQKILNQSKKEN